MIILETVIGSRLYGTYHENSDVDVYRVVLDGVTRQNIVGENDNITVSLNDFLRQVDKGVPQALEALYSPVKKVDPRYEAFFNSLKPSTQVFSTYRRTIKYINSSKKTMSFNEMFMKQKLYKLRLAHNLNELVLTGRMNPCLSAELVQLFRRVCSSSEDEYYKFLNSFSIVELV